VTDERWQRVKSLFQAAAERPPAERAAFLDAATGDDDALRREVDSLLTSDTSDVSFLDLLPDVREHGLDDPLYARPESIAPPPALTGLAPGHRVGPYRIVGPLGVGAMGEVYRACDTTLNREVALKVLPELFALEPDRRMRFEREAQLLAALNHPNIAAIYGLEQCNGAQALVLELVDGPTLGDRIACGPIPVQEALSISRQIVLALEAAHEKNIIHRDLKPANIKITGNGVVKVLDFGLAKVRDGAPLADLSRSPRLTATDIGGRTLLGSPAYMSPEQARGQSLDRRTDIWSFGCVLYEMLTGRPSFAGDTISDTFVAILEREPDRTMLPADTPAPTRRLLRRCLKKDRKERLDSAADARLEIDDAIAPPADEALAAAPTGSRRVIAAAIAALAGAWIAGLVVWTLMRPGPATPVLQSRFAIVSPPGQPLNVSGSTRDLALSPDGRRLVYRFGGTSTTGSPLVVRAIDHLDAQPMAEVVLAYAPFFSPDSRWIGFFENMHLKKAPIAGGAPITLCRISGVPLGASWGDDNTITFATNSPGTGLWRVSADGGTPTVLTTPDPAQREGNHAFPSVLPHRRGVLFTIPTVGEADSPHVAALDLKTGQRKRLIRGTDAEYVETGHLIFAAAGALRAVRFDPVRLQVLSDPVLVAEHVMMKPSGAANYTVSRSGTLVYVPGGPRGETPTRSIVWVDRKGHEERINNAPLRGYGPPRLSPDGARLAIGILDQGNTEIWIWDFARETLRRLTFAPGMDGLPVWTPDSRRIIFMSDRMGVLNLYSQSADGGGIVERLTTSAAPQWPTAITPNGRWLVGFTRPATTSDVVFFPLTDSATRPGSAPASSIGSSPTEPLADAQFNGSLAEFSPDGRYLAYQSDESGRMEVYVRPFPHVDRSRWQISTDGGSRPVWARSGRELFYLDESSALTGIPVRTSGSTFLPGSPTKLFTTRYVEPNPARHYDVSPDGRRFLMIKNSAEGDPNATPASMVVVEHWFEELKRRVPTNGK
jgi:eukaryotic-like serine/threonine-protein kinase